jgi:putative tryptophan/tyrosine transport system substrate-binding protein
VSNDHEIDDAFATLVQLRAGAVVIPNDPFFNARTKQLAALALRHAVPTIFQYREFTAAGGLMTTAAALSIRTARPACTPAGF